MAKLTFPRNRRLSGKIAFARVFAAKCSASDKLLVIYAIANGLDRTRLGLSVGRKHGNAVARNRIKRLLREAMRLETPNLRVGYDLVIVPRTSQSVKLTELRESLRLVSQRSSNRCKPLPGD